MHFWLRQFSVTTAALDADISKSTTIDVYQWFREVCTTTLLNIPIVLGGNGVIVEIGESLYLAQPAFHRCHQHYKTTLYYAHDYVMRRAIAPQSRMTTPLSISTRCRSLYLIPFR